MSNAAGGTRITILVDNAARDGLSSEHGFSAWIEAGNRRLLFDTGQGPALAGNADRLGVDLRVADTLVLSHGHFDHTGGVPHVVDRAPGIEVFSHPDATKPRYALRHGSAKSIGMPGGARLAIERLPATNRHQITQPRDLGTGLGLTGPIPRVTEFEDTGGPFFVDAGGRQDDPIADDLALWVRTERGLVVVVGCSHGGLVNTLRHARRLSGDARVHAVLGGFHLMDAGEARIRRTVEALADLDVDLIVPCHCTGARAVERLSADLGGRVSPGAAGSTYTFGGANAGE